MNTDRNLLFGVLALQTDLIDSAQFADACAAWATRKATPLADLLIERGWITATDKLDIERLMERKVKRHGGDMDATLDAVMDSGVREAMLTVADPELRRSIARLSSVSGHVLVDPLGRPTESRTKYTLTRLHGQGGLGRVWVARDNDLNREVALKEMQQDSAENLVATARFLKEAQITGQLEHPNIVPVYELGRRSGDQPFYTMRFLRGQTLRHAISDYHKNRKQGTAGALQLRGLLGAFVNVCHALAYAHSRGVIHRDVKPSNIALGDFGEVVVLDWGLAKVAHAEDRDSATMALTDAASGSETVAGRAIGTPSYMSPEQAQGRQDLVGVGSDVYGLGATLFAILTDRPPHKGENTAETLKQIITGATPRVRAIDSQLPAALDAICAKAMAKEVADRYAKASQLAEDIQRWLADEPVSVYREPWPQRLARWTRRHRAWTQAAAAALILVTIVSTVASFVIQRARAEADRARQAESLARNEATQHFKAARQAIGAHTSGISEVLKYYPGVQQARERLLRRAADDYERLAHSQSDNVELRTEFARAFIQLGDVRVTLAELRGAEEAYRAAESNLNQLCKRDHATEQLVDRAHCRTKLGIVLDLMGQNEQSELAYRMAISELESLVDSHPDRSDIRDELATGLFNFARLSYRKAGGSHADAAEVLARAIQHFTLLAENSPGETRWKFALASAQDLHGQELSRQGHNRQAVDVLREAIDSFERLGRADPDHPDYVEARAGGQIDLAAALITLGRDGDERNAYEAALADLEDLCRVLPDVPRYRESIAITRTDLAQLLRKLGRNTEAIDASQTALTAFRQLAESPWPLPRYTEELVAASSVLGQVFSDLGQNDNAMAAFQFAIEQCQELTRSFDEPQYRERLAVCQSNLGRLLHKLHRFDEARTCLDKSISLFDLLVSSGTASPSVRDGLAWSSDHLGDLLLEMDQPQEAAVAFRKALQLREALAQELDEPQYLHDLARLLSNCADRELRDPARAVEVAAHARDISPECARSWNRLGVAYFRSGELAAAIEAIERAERLRASPHAEDAFFLAMAYHQHGDPNFARQRFDDAAEWTQQNCSGNLELQRLQAEAQKLLGIASKPK